jgi:uncharacterized protein YndB with AHSA1/START domain
MSFTGTLQVTTQGDREVRLVREFDAPRRLVWDCFTKPELVRRWLFGPDGWSFLVCEIDFRVGGSYRYVWHNPAAGAEMGMKGTYREIVPHERIADAQVFDQDWTGGEAISTLVFTERNGPHHGGQHDALLLARGARCGAGIGHEGGMALGYDRLEQFMSTLPAGGSA